MVNDAKNILKISKGKIRLPSDYGFSNGESLFLTLNVFAPLSIAIYTKAQWIPIREKLLAKSISTGGVSGDLNRQVIANAAECLVKEGVLCIPLHLLNLAQLKNETLWIAGETRVELWDPENFDVQNSK